MENFQELIALADLEALVDRKLEEKLEQFLPPYLARQAVRNEFTYEIPIYIAHLVLAIQRRFRALFRELTLNERVLLRRYLEDPNHYVDRLDGFSHAKARQLVKRVCHEMQNVHGMPTLATSESEMLPLLIESSH